MFVVGYGGVEWWCDFEVVVCCWEFGVYRFWFWWGCCVVVGGVLGVVGCFFL